MGKSKPVVPGLYLRCLQSRGVTEMSTQETRAEEFMRQAAEHVAKLRAADPDYDRKQRGRTASISSVNANVRVRTIGA